MTNIEKDAFPHEFKYGDGTADRAGGMTLRDYFAAKAMQGLIADGALKDSANRVYSIAGLSFQQADAMLKAREA